MIVLILSVCIANVLGYNMNKIYKSIKECEVHQKYNLKLVGK